MLEEERLRQIAMIHGRIDSKCYRSFIYGSLGKDSSSNINDVVDRVLAKHKKEHKIISKPKKKLPLKKIVPVTLISLLLVLSLPYLLPPLFGDFGSDLRVELYPSDGVYVNDTLYVNLTIPSGYNVTMVSADMAGVEIIDLLFVYNDSFVQFWQGVWFVHGLIPGEYIIGINAIDNANVSYSAGVGLSVLPELKLPVVNDSINGTQPKDVNVFNNETMTLVGLNLTLGSDKFVYFVNETVLISGIVSFNDSLINTSVNVSVFGSNISWVDVLNVSDGLFIIDFIVFNVGDFIVNVSVVYENISVSRELSLLVVESSIENISENTSEISIVDPQVREELFVLPGSSFYVERTVVGLDGLQAVFAPLFSDGLTLERFEIVGGNVTRGRSREVVSDLASGLFVSDDGVSGIERRIDNIREHLPSDIKSLDRVGYCSGFVLHEPVTVRVWFRAPVWDDIVSDRVPGSGRISYLTFAGDDFDFESSTWWNSNWYNRKLITINSSQIETDLTNFPILINITDTDLRDDAQDDGDDIAFVLYSDNSTQLNHEIELYNGTTGQLYAWVNITSLSSSYDTKIWMYYNNSESSNQQNSTGVWDSNFVGVWHLNELVTDESTSGKHIDSTFNNNNGSQNNNDDISGIIGIAQDFDGNDYINITSTSSLQITNAITLSGWINLRSFGIGSDVDPILRKGEVNPNNYQLMISDYLPHFVLNGNDEFPIGTSSLSANTWYYIVGTWESDGSRIVYLNGTQDGTGAFTGPIPTDIRDLYIGGRAGTDDIDGILDEVRISNTARNVSWIRTTYNNVINTSTFINIESEEYNVDTFIDIISPYNVTYSPLTINATGASGLDNVTLYYRFSTDNSSWGINVSWDNDSNPDNEFPWEWSFNFSNGTGYYEFYSIGNKSGFSDESPPTNPDTICYFNESLNTLPEIALINPQPNGTTGVGLLPLCQVWANDSDGDTLTVYWYENTTGSWILRNTNDSVSADSIVSYNFTQFSNYSTTFWWMVAINDSIDNISWCFYFSTESILTSVDDIVPYVVTSSPFVVTTTGDGNLDNVTLYYRWSDDNSSWGHSGETIYDTPTIDNIASETDNANVNSMNWAHIVSSGLNNSILIVGVNVEDDDAGDNYYVASADFNNDALTYAVRVAADEGFSAVSEIWYLLNPDAGSNIVRVNFSIVVNNALGGSASFSNVKQLAPYNTNTAVNTGSPNGISTSINTEMANSLMIVVATDGQGTFEYSYGSGQTQIYDVAGTTHEGAGSRSLSSAAGSSTLYTNLSGASNRMSQVVAAWTPSSSVTWGNGSDWAIWSNASNPDTINPWSWGFDFLNGTGYYEFYSIGNKSGSPDESAPGSADAICLFNRIPTITNEGPSNESTDIQILPQMNITIDDLDGDLMTVTWYSNSSGSWQVFGTNVSVGNGPYHQTNNNFSDYFTTYWWYVTVSDGINTNTSDTFYFTTIAVLPIIYTNTSAGVEETNATLCGYLQNNGGLETTCGFRYGTSSGIYTENYTKDTYPSNSEFSNNNDSLTPGQIYNYQAWAINSIGFVNGSEKTFLTKPQEPTNLAVQQNNSSVIYLTWTKGAGANNTYIERNTTGLTSWDRGQGTVIYNGSGTNYEDTGLTQGTIYYYQAWSYTTWTDVTSLYQWSDNNVSSSNSTNYKPTIEPITPSNGSTCVNPQPTCQIWANDTNGNILTIDWYENTTGSWILRQTNTSVSANSTLNWTFTQANAYGTTYWWRVSVNDSYDNVTFLYYFATNSLNTSVDTISPYVITTSPLTITATNFTPVDNISLYYIYSPDNTTWQKPSGDWWNDNFKYRSKIILTEPQGLNRINTHVLITIDIEEGKLSNENGSAFVYNGIQLPFDGYSLITENGWVTQLQGLVEINISAYENKTCYLYYDPVYSSSEILPTITGWNYVGATSYSGANYVDLTTSDVDCYGDDSDGQHTSVCGAVDYLKLNEWCYFKSPQTGNIYFKTGSDDGSGLWLNDTLIVTDNNGAHAEQWRDSLAQSLITGRYYAIEIDFAEQTGVQVIYNRWDTVSGDNSNGNIIDSEGYTFYGDEWEIDINIVNEEYTENWNLYEVDQNYPWSWEFNFPNGSGYYEFYSVGKKSGSADESAPSSADAICRYNRLPTITNEVPSNGSVNIQLIPQLGITVNDPDGDSMNVTWYSNSSGSWQIFSANNSVLNGTYYQTNSNFSSPGTTYWWYVSVYDGANTNNSGIFHFATSYQPILSNPNPSNGSTGHYPTPICNITVSDVDGGTVTVRFYENTTGSWVLQQTNSSVDVTNPTNIIWDNNSNATQDYTTCWWLVNVSDGKGCYVEEIYHFTTANTAIEITPDRWDQGVLMVGSSNETTGFYFNLTNNGDVPLYIQIKASNATNATTGGLWILNATSDYDNFTLQYNKSGGGVWTTINLTYDLFVSNLDIGSWQTFDLKLIMATLSSTTDPLSMDLTFRSIKA